MRRYYKRLNTHSNFSKVGTLQIFSGYLIAICGLKNKLSLLLSTGNSPRVKIGQKKEEPKRRQQKLLSKLLPKQQLAGEEAGEAEEAAGQMMKRKFKSKTKDKGDLEAPATKTTQRVRRVEGEVPQAVEEEEAKMFQSEQIKIAEGQQTKLEFSLKVQSRHQTSLHNFSNSHLHLKIQRCPKLRLPLSNNKLPKRILMKRMVVSTTLFKLKTSMLGFLGHFKENGLFVQGKRFNLNRPLSKYPNNHHHRNHPSYRLNNPLI